MVGLIGIVIALALFLTLVYKGWSSYWVAPICAVIVAVFNLMDPETAISAYIAGMSDLMVSLFSVVFFGSILGKFYNESGAAAAIATTLTNKLVIKAKGDTQIRLGILVVLIVTALCTMGGIDGYVLTFTMVPICFIISEMLDIPRRFIGGMMCLNCAFMAAPGAPQIDNIMARAGIMSEAFNEEGEFIQAAASTGFNINSSAAFIPGLVATIFIVVAGYIYLCSVIIKAKKAGEHFDWGTCRKIDIREENRPNFVVALLPLLTVFIIYTLIPVVSGISVNVALALGAGIIVGLIFMGRYLPARQKGERTGGILKLLNEGSESAPGALLTVITPAALAGVITATSAFGIVVGMLSGIQVHWAVLALIVVCVLVGITSSPPAALMIAMPLVMNIMVSQGMDPATVLENTPGLMRIGSIAATTFETLPINGLIILTLHLIGCSHKEAYKPMFMQTVLFTLIGACIATAMIVLFPGLV